MTITIGTYLPPWGSDKSRVLGYDEDALTLAVAAGRQAIGESGSVTQVVFVSRDFPLLEGGNTAVLLAGLGLGHELDVVERLGGAPATLDALVMANPGTLVIGVDAGDTAGAAAALVGKSNPVTSVARIQRSMPQRTRLLNGQTYSDEDPRLMRELGVRSSIEAAHLPGKPLFIAGLGAKDATSWAETGAPALPTLGAASVLFGIAALIEKGRSGLIAASEQAAFSAANLDVSSCAVRRNEPAFQAPAKRKATPGTGIKISLAAYDRAFESKLRWQAGKCSKCGTLALPPRYRCLGCNTNDSWELIPLPRTATIYTTTTVNVTVPSLESPYTLAVIECDGVGVRSLVHVTDVPPDTVDIGDPGKMVLRRVAMRTGVPDYGYAFSPDRVRENQTGGAK